MDLSTCDQINGSDESKLTFNVATLNVNLLTLNGTPRYIVNFYTQLASLASMQDNMLSCILAKLASCV